MAPRAKQSRNVVCISYAPLRVIRNALDLHRENIRAWAYIYHDHDVYEDGDLKGQLKEPHFHIMIRLYRPFTHSAIKRWFACVNDEGALINTHVVCCSDVGSYFDYLIHKYNPDKYQYDPALRICSNPADFIEDDAICQDNLSDALEDILKGVPSYEIVKKYGRDFIIHSRTLYELADRIRCERSYRSEAQWKEVNELPF